MPQEKKKANYLAQGWLVLLLALAFGAALAGVHATLSGRIRQNKDNDTLGRIPELVPGATAGREKTIGDMTVYEAVDDNGRQVGWVITGSGSGYSPGIEILIGLDMPAEKITGLYVLEHKETPGLGSKISDDPRWAEQFIDKSAAEPLTVTKKAPAGNEILAVTAATTTSEGVCRIVNGAVRKFRDALARAGGRDPLLETIPQAVPGTRTAEKMTVGGLVVYKAADDSGRHVGWAVLASGRGYSGTIELLIGLDAPAERLTGLLVLGHKETTKAADAITESNWLKQFAGKSAARELKCVQADPHPGGSDIKAVTSATITSRSICAIINEALAKVRDKLAAAEEQP